MLAHIFRATKGLAATSIVFFAIVRSIQKIPAQEIRSMSKKTTGEF